MKILAVSICLALASLSVPTAAQDLSRGADNFYTSQQVSVQKVSFPTRYGLKVAGNLYTPKNLERSKQLAAIVVGHPMGAGQPKELVVVPGAGHVDLYDRVDLIAFAKLTAFFKQNLGAH